MPVESVTFEDRRDKLRRDIEPLFYEASGSFEIAADTFRNLLEAMRPRYRGASDATLSRRVFFGGRKGRSALRRLFARGYAGVAMTVAGPMLIPATH